MQTIDPLVRREVTLLHVRFVKSPEPGDRVLMRLEEPDSRVATCRSLPFAEYANPSTAETSSSPTEAELFILQLSPTAGVLWRAEAESWIAEVGTGLEGQILHSKVEGGFVLWKPGFAVVQTTAELQEPMLDALVDFSFYEGELRKLEREVAADWSRAQADVPLVHHVAKAELARGQQVGHMARSVALRRLRCARIGPRLLGVAPGSGDAAARLAARLRDEANVEARFEMVDSQLEVYEYQYEMISQRISDYTHFRHEYVVEIVIVVLLAAELVTMAVDFAAHHQLLY